ncbi:hypothetical protein BXT84_06755 [Sulfobacillus thermotolerans]|uniref:Glyceraldehyde 3-phosphate dehydrogenase catalytic domain-containing protein n=2 Tax=Clostridiales Family XVII. Incertae Sedis TaxID=539000 RepID=A0ABM6RQM5_9FIRM|nr:hypothetical protein BXT84_06755 [Sulfobacillus thermotolerans]
MIVTPCGAPRTWWHIEVAADLSLRVFQEKLGGLWPSVAHGVFVLDSTEHLDSQSVANVFIPGLIVRYDSPTGCLMVQVISWYDGQSAPDQTMAIMATSLRQAETE